MSNRRTPRNHRKHTRLPKQPLPYDAFKRELTRVVNGDADADPHVAAYFDDMCEAMGIEAAVRHESGLEVLRRVPR